jgi:hypothetical protein
MIGHTLMEGRARNGEGEARDEQRGVRGPNAMSVLRGAEMGRIEATTKVNDVLQRHPLTGEVFIQHGPLGVAAPGKLYLQYPEQTVGQYAERNGVDLRALLRLLNAAAEATDLEAKGLRPQPTARGRPPEGPIGYTSAYRELKDFDIETESVVVSQRAHGPD